MRGVLIIATLAVLGVAVYLILSTGGNKPIDDTSPNLSKQEITPQTPSTPEQKTPQQLPPKEDSDFVKAYRSGLDFVSKGMPYKARQSFTTAYWGDIPEDMRQVAKQQMIAINTKLIASKDELRDAEVYEVKSGDVLAKIAKKFPGTTAGQIRLANGLVGDMIHPAQKLKILNGKFSIYIQKSKFNLQLLYDGSVVKEYKIAIGKDEETPTGKFTIETTEKNPTWYMTDKKTGKKEAIKYGDPRNILGDRWMGFNKPNSSYGIHGTTDDTSIGTRASSGCIRMHNNDVIELYEIIPTGADVTIKD